MKKQISYKVVTSWLGKDIINAWIPENTISAARTTARGLRNQTGKKYIIVQQTTTFKIVK